MRGALCALWLVGCLGTGLTPLNLDTGGDTGASGDAGGNGGGGGGNGGGGGDADTDTDTDADADTDSDSDTDDTCVWPSATLTPTSPGAGTMTPVYVSVDLYGIIDGGSDFRDFELDGDELAASAIFTFYSDTVAVLCQVAYEVTLDSVPAWSSSSGQIGAAFELQLPAGDGEAAPNCRGVSGGIFPTTDIRDWIEAEDWGVGIGDVDANQAAIQNLASLLGYSYGADWAPHIYGTYLWRGGADAIEVGYGFRYSEDCGVVDGGSGALVFLDAPAPGDVDGYHQTFPLLVVNVGS